MPKLAKPANEPLLTPHPPHDKSLRYGGVLPLLIAIGILGLSLVPKPDALAVADIQNLNWPTAIVHQSLPLSTTETSFFGRHPQTQVQKQTFTYRSQTTSLSGSMLLVSSRSWLAHHAPETCFVGNGYEVNHLQTKQLAGVPLHWLELNRGQYSATYWFQSRQQTTADFLTRMWQQISHREAAWVMVSLVFDQPHQPGEPVVQEFVHTVHQALQQNFTGQV